MPKKTKKEKLLALYHKKIRLLEDKHAAAPTASSVSFSPQKPKFAPKIKIETKLVNFEKQQLNKYFFSDLKKSLILIVLIIGVEVGLYFVKLIK
jgi:hypothetical protein